MTAACPLQQGALGDEHPPGTGGIQEKEEEHTTGKNHMNSVAQFNHDHHHHRQHHHRVVTMFAAIVDASCFFLLARPRASVDEFEMS